MPRFDLLRRLAKELRKKQLPEGWEFRYDRYNYELSNNPKLPVGCGTAGCAIGLCPIIWPEQWVFVENKHDFHTPSFGGYLSPLRAAEEFFDLPSYDAIELFENHELLKQDTPVTRQQVAKLIEDYCNKNEPKP